MTFRRQHRINREAVMKYTGHMFELDGLLTTGGPGPGRHRPNLERRAEGLPEEDGVQQFGYVAGAGDQIDKRASRIRPMLL